MDEEEKGGEVEDEGLVEKEDPVELEGGVGGGILVERPLLNLEPSSLAPSWLDNEAWEG